MAKRKASGITPDAPSPPGEGSGVESSSPSLAKSAAAVARTSNLASLPLDYEDLAAAILNHLTVADDILRLSMVTKGWRDYMARNDEMLFKDLLVDAFPEGDLLAGLVEKNQRDAAAADDDAAGTNDGDGKTKQAAAPRLTYKGIYLGFLHRFEDVGEGYYSCDGRCNFHWDPATKVNDVQDDLEALAFIARVDDEHCFEMEWHDESECERHCAEIVHRSSVHLWNNSCERPRYDRSQWGGMLRLKNPGKSSFSANYFQDQIPQFCLTLYVIDIEQCSVMTLVKGQGCNDVYRSHNDNEPEGFRENDGVFYHGLVNDGIQKTPSINYDCTEMTLVRPKQDGDIDLSGYLLCEGSMEYGVEYNYLLTDGELATFQMFDRNGVTFVFTADEYYEDSIDEGSILSILRAIMEKNCK